MTDFNITTLQVRLWKFDRQQEKDILHKVVVMLDESMKDELVSELFDLSLVGYWLNSWNVHQEAWNYSIIDLKFIPSNDMTTNIDADTIGMVLNLIG